ncbi:MAG TPA: glycosyltransferase family 2 protein [Stellaceae bacterium]|nr:glycosyltransferase family 2 protein [Stellaceae bacterium]
MLANGATRVLDQITPLIITHNEAPNICRTLEKLRWARRIVVIDSGSTDDTIEILRNHPKVEVIHRPFADFASQCNFGLAHVDSPWVLSLDADYELSDEIAKEFESLSLNSGPAGYQARFVYRMFGRPLRGALYPPRIVLYRKKGAFYRNEGHAHRVVLEGEILPLNGVIYHDDRKPLSRWLASQQRYASDEATYLLKARSATVTRTDKIRLMAWPAPIAVFFYALLVKGCLFDGWPGWAYVLQRVIAEALIALEIINRRLTSRTKPGNDTG